MSNRFCEATWRASERCRLHDERRAAINDFISVRHLGPVYQGLCGELRLLKIRNVPHHGHREPFYVRFNWLFNKGIHGRVLLARLYEAGIVGHLVVVDSRRWLSHIYDSCDPYLLILSSSSLFH